MSDKEKETAEPEEEYESDLDDAPLPVVRRRAAASDDESEQDELPARGRVGSDGESDGQGAAEAYDEELYEDGEEEYEDEYEEFEKGRGGDGGVAPEAAAAAGEGEEEGVEGEAKAGEAAAGEEEGKKESEPYAVPTAGAFYMHDDRFQEAGGRGRGRKMLSNRKLWNPKEEETWVHDRFDQQEYHNGNIRNPRGRFRGRGGGPGGRTRGVSRGNFRGGRSRGYHDGNQNYTYVPKESHIHHDKNARRVPHDNGKNIAPKLSRAHYDDIRNVDVFPKESRTYYGDARRHKDTPKVIRGRGSKRYQARWRSTAEISSEQNNKSQNPENASSDANLGKQQSQISNPRPDQGFPIKQPFASNLNSASPPFYPSRPCNLEPPIGHRSNAQPSTTSGPFSPSIGVGHVSSTPQYAHLSRGKAFVPSVEHGKLHVEAATKAMDAPVLHPSPSLSSPYPVATNQVIRDSVQPSHPVAQQWSVQPSTQSTSRMPTQMFGARFTNGDKIPSPTQPMATILTEDTGVGSPRGSNKAITGLTVKGQDVEQGKERASFLYGGGHVLGATGAMGLTPGNQGFHGTPAFLPVMQFGGQHPGGSGIPSIGMALPGFVSQQQLGLSKSEMTWLPILAGSSGALGGTYGSPYIAMDGSYSSRLSEQASSSVSRREPSAISSPSQLKSPEITEVVSDELNQRQNKPRRYSAMNFGQ